MDERVPEAEAADTVGDEGVAGRAAQPREEPPRFRGRPKKPRPAAPGLTDALADTLGHFFPELGAWFARVDEGRKSGTARFRLAVSKSMTVIFMYANLYRNRHAKTERRAIMGACSKAHRRESLQTEAPGFLLFVVAP